MSVQKMSDITLINKYNVHVHIDIHGLISSVCHLYIHIDLLNSVITHKFIIRENVSKTLQMQ